MVYFLLAGFIYALLAPLVHRLLGKFAIVVQVALPLLLFGYFAGFLPTILAGQVYSEAHSWVPSLGIDLNFYLDGLALLQITPSRAAAVWVRL